MKKEVLLVFAVLLALTGLFFYPVFQGNIPFPGDLLVGNTGPYNTNSYGGYGPGAVPHKAQGPDVIRQLFPWKYFVIESFKHGQIPFWNPYNFSGNPLMANFQSATFYPLNSIFFLTSFADAWSMFIFLTPLLAAFFTYFYLREIGIRSVAAVYAGVVFAFSGYMVVWMEYGNIGHVFLWLPLALFLTEILVKRFTKHVWMLLLLVLTCAIVGGYIQGYFYSAGFLAFYFGIKKYTEKKLLTKTTVLFGLALVLPAFLTLFQLLPTFDLFRFSTRGNYSLETIQQLLNPLWYAITVIAPDFFGNPASRNHWFYGTYIERVSFFGVIPFLLALIALFRYKEKREARIFGIIFLITFFLAFNFVVTKYIFLIPIPVLSTTVPTRILSLFAFSGALLSGIGMHMLLEKKYRFMYLPYIPAVFLLIMAWNIALFADKLFPAANWISNMQIMQRNLLIPSLLVLVFAVAHFFLSINKKFTLAFILLVCVLTGADLFRFFHKITPFSPKEYLYPETPVISYIQKEAGINRYWGYGTGHIDTNFQLFDKTYFPDGNDPLHIRTYTEFLESSRDGKIPEELPRPDANIVPGFGSDDLKQNIYRQKVLNALGVKYVIQKNEGLTELLVPDTAIFDDKIYRLVWQQKPYQIYENMEAAPRYFLTADYIVVPDKRKLLETFYDGKFDETSMVLLSENPGIAKAQLRTKQTVLKQYTPNEVIIETEADKDALLFLSDTHYYAWKATVDGKPTKIYQATYAFRAVTVPKGKHVVRFFYASESFNAGLVISGLVFILLIIGYSRMKKYYA